MRPTFPALMLATALTGTAVATPAARPLSEPSPRPPEQTVTTIRSAPSGFGWPLPGSRDPHGVVRTFDAPETAYGPGHRGVDLAGIAGRPVRAAAAGTVVHAGRLVDRNVISIEHPGGLRTTYEPVTPEVAAGQRVVRGQRIGTLDTGHPECAAPPSAACLHWGARLHLDYLDPLRLLGHRAVRLLPWRDVPSKPR